MGKHGERDFIFVGSKTTADGDCSHEIKRRLFLGKKAMTNIDSILKSRDITLPTEVCLVKAMVFSVVMYACETWTIKKAEHQRIDVFELWCWIRLLKVQLSHPYMTTGKTLALIRQTFVDKVMFLLFNMLSRLVITFLPRRKCLLISWLQSPSTVILEHKK